MQRNSICLKLRAIICTINNDFRMRECICQRYSTCKTQIGVPNLECPLARFERTRDGLQCCTHAASRRRSFYRTRGEQGFHFHQETATGGKYSQNAATKSARLA